MHFGHAHEKPSYGVNFWWVLSQVAFHKWHTCIYYQPLSLSSPWAFLISYCSWTEIVLIFSVSVIWNLNQISSLRSTSEKYFWIIWCLFSIDDNKSQKEQTEEKGYDKQCSNLLDILCETWLCWKYCSIGSGDLDEESFLSPSPT